MPRAVRAPAGGQTGSSRRCWDSNSGRLSWDAPSLSQVPLLLRARGSPLPTAPPSLLARGQACKWELGSCEELNHPKAGTSEPGKATTKMLSVWGSPALSTYDKKESDFKAINILFKSFPKTFPVSRCAHPDRPDTHITPAGTDALAAPASPPRNSAQRSSAAPAKHFGDAKTGSRRSRCLAKSPFSLGKKSRGGEKWGSGPESLPRSPGPPDAKRGGERGGRTHPGPPMARPRLPQPRARLRARPPAAPAPR